MSDQETISTTQKIRSAYDGLVAAGSIEADEAQIELITQLDDLIARLANRRLSSKSSALGWLFGRNNAPETFKGMYIWGGVGRGKSMIMDLFFANLPHKRKRRVHFNDFMQDAQERIHAHRQAFTEGNVKEEDPIPVVGRKIAEEASILCFDEFTVTDIADAMILGRLFETLFEEGVVVIATSNVVPENLYKDGLNRKIFLPFIDILTRHVDVFELKARKDFRLEKLNRAEVYLHPVNPENEAKFDAAWHVLIGRVAAKEEVLDLKGRSLVVEQAASGVARLSFKTLCEEPRSANDYLAIARRFHTLFIEGVPVMAREQHNAAKRFILLIDTLYDNSMRIVVLAEALPKDLYTGKSGTEAFEFARTISRLNEMQSVEYIAGSKRD